MKINLSKTFISKRLLSILLNIFFIIGLFISQIGSAYATNIAYISGEGEPWDYGGGPSNVWEMDAVFGTGNWDRLTFSSAAALPSYSGYDFIFIDGGDGYTTDYVNFMATEKNDLQDWVTTGGSIYEQVARWFVPGNIDVGFGATLVEGYGPSASADAAGHVIFTDMGYGSPGTSWTGDYFSHDYLDMATMPGYLSLIIDQNGRSVLAETAYGAGHAIVGGMTISQFQYPRREAQALHKNILNYAYSLSTPVPEPSAIFLLGSGLVGLVGAMRKKFKKK